MRVAFTSFTQSLIDQFNSLALMQNNLQQQVSSGLRVQAPSDDPGAMESTLNDLSAQATQQQYSTNIATLQARGNSIYSVLQSLQTISNRVGEITTAAGNPTNSPSDLQNYASEVTQLIQQAAQLVNAKDAATGQYLFGGTDSGQQPFTVAKDADGNVTGVTYGGNGSTNQVEISSGVTVSIDVPGANTSSSGTYGLITDSRTGADFFNHLIALQNDLQSGNTAAITGTDATNLKNDENNFAYQVAYNGNIQTRLDTASSFATSQSSSLNTSITNTSGADLVQTMVQLNQAQNAYQAALASSAKIMQMSLLDYLK